MVPHNFSCQFEYSALFNKTQNLLFICFFLFAGAKPDSEQSKPSALCYSISLGHERCTKLLLKNGASVNLQGEGGRGALHEAALRNDVDAVRSLVVRGADVNMKDENGITPLGVCKALRSHKKCYQILQHMASK